MNELKDLKVVFFGSSNFAKIVLENILNQVDLLAVVTQPAKPVGKKALITPTPVQEYCQEKGIDFFDFKKLKDESAFNLLENLKADIFIVAAYGKIVPNEILNIPKFKSINIHGSILPKYRGASPIQAALLNGEKITGTTIMIMDDQVDHGKVLSIASLDIEPTDTFAELESKLAVIGSKDLLESLKKYINNELEAKEQDHDQATFTSLINKEDGFVDWSLTAIQIFNKWRAYKQWPQLTSFLEVNGKKLRVRLNDLSFPSEEISKLNQGQIGFFNNKIFVGTFDSNLEITNLTLEGKNTVSAQAFINGYKGLNGTSFLNV